VDGIMIGRAAIGYPWVFREIKHYLATGEHLAPATVEERADVIRRHLRRSIEWKGQAAGINEMRRHYGNYLKGLPNIRGFRQQLVTVKTFEEVDAILGEIVKTYTGYAFERRTDALIETSYTCG
jgi:tRNA-dihydrouridine synthase